MNNPYRISFFHSEDCLFGIDSNSDTNLNKGDRIFLASKDHTQVEQANALISRKWKVKRVTRSFSQETYRCDPTPEWPLNSKIMTIMNVEVDVVPVRYWTIGIRKDHGRWFSAENDNRFFRIWKFYVGLGYLFR